MDTKPLTVDGFLDTVPTPGDAPYTVRFQLVVSPTDDVVDDVIWSCTTSKPGIAHTLLTEIQPGDLLHVSGILTQPDNPAEPARLTVDALEVLATAPARALQEMVLDRYGDYVVVFDADTDAVPVFTALGQWVGEAESPDTIGTLIEIHERVNGGDG
ncbi:hypothetical protein PV728_43845 [Streptomyces europaeiscabiei]|uniref:hypothetical protein n=1 Tax=Streptomyces TaxID=1883 RepID=UPI0029B50E74|nr:MULTISPECIES: hypothetical protein [Streptomyces]MDX2521649.1 hypothetical protein [Streptomyces stelliscabiei]MDX3637007.1 hypothetical protein [Streptomyces europaeiscabiei]MDX3655151.1 hypothetical protein [Streptomyces europaeiscabiei]